MVVRLVRRRSCDCCEEGEVMGEEVAMAGVVCTKRKVLGSEEDSLVFSSKMRGVRYTYEGAPFKSVIHLLSIQAHKKKQFSFSDSDSGCVLILDLN